MDEVNLLKWGIASVGLIIIMGALALLARRVGPVSLNGVKGDRRMKMKEVLHLDARNKIYIVEIDGQDQVVGVGANLISSLPRKSQPLK